MTSTLTPSEDAQLAQTIEMFEVITRSQPADYQSLEILKEAYVKLGRDADALNTSKRIAQAYVQMGQLSSAILEYETILQRYPNDPDIKTALAAIEKKADDYSSDTEYLDHTAKLDTHRTAKPLKTQDDAGPQEIDEGRQALSKVFVDGKHITAGDFDLCWRRAPANPTEVTIPFIQTLNDKDIFPVERSLKLLSDKSRAAFLPLALYDVDMDLTRKFPKSLCWRWSILPFDRMSKSLLVATANPFNVQAAKELSQIASARLIWYLVWPADLLKLLRRAFR